MPWEKFTLTTQTPMFLDSDPEHGPRTNRFPVASLRGALRFWLRALAGEHLGGTRDRLDDLAQVEAAVFGTVSGDDDAGPSPVRLRATSEVEFSREASPQWVFKDVPYLLGLGLCRPGKPPKLQRRHVPAGKSIRLAVKFAEEDSACGDLFLSALWALCSFGGLGARVRRGVGTLRVTQVPKAPYEEFRREWLNTLDSKDLPKVLEVVSSAITRSTQLSRSEPPATEPCYPCFAPGYYRVFDTAIDCHSMKDALSRTSSWWRGFRLYRRAETQPQRGDSTPEYGRMIKPYIENGPSENRSQKPFYLGAFGLPVVFHDKTTDKSAQVEPVLDGQPLRRASPLWLRVHQSKDGWSVRSLAFFAEWLPADADLEVSNEDWDAQSLVRPPQQAVNKLVHMWFPNRDG